MRVKPFSCLRRLSRSLSSRQIWICYHINSKEQNHSAVTGGIIYLIYGWYSLATPDEGFLTRHLNLRPEGWSVPSSPALTEPIGRGPLWCLQHGALRHLAVHRDESQATFVYNKFQVGRRLETLPTGWTTLYCTSLRRSHCKKGVVPQQLPLKANQLIFVLSATAYHLID